MWGLGSCIVSLVAALNFLAGLFFYTYFATHQSGVQPLSASVILLLALIALPAAVAGLVLSLGGHHSPARRGLARAGIIFSLMGLLPFLVALVVLSVTAAYCSTHLCL